MRVWLDPRAASGPQWEMPGRRKIRFRHQRSRSRLVASDRIIGQEALKQMESAGEYPDVVIWLALVADRIFAGLPFPFWARSCARVEPHASSPSEPEACPTLTRGTYAYDFRRYGWLTPAGLKMHIARPNFVPPAIRCGWLRLSRRCAAAQPACRRGRVEATAYAQEWLFEAAIPVRRPRASSRARVGSRDSGDDRTKRCGRVKPVNARLNPVQLSGHGHFDMGAI